jgi:hypothetical protein
MTGTFGEESCISVGESNEAGNCVAEPSHSAKAVPAVTSSGEAKLDDKIPRVFRDVACRT